MSKNLKFWRESASLIIAAKSTFSKPSTYNYKILSLQRSQKSGFMPNTYVFPGGKISSGDDSEKWLQLFKKFGCTIESLKDLYPMENIPPILEAKEDFGKLPKYISLRICAIRETFEECGILLCKNPDMQKDKTNWATYYEGHEILKWQHKVHKDPNEFINLCSHFNLYPDVWSLQNWSNWITPPSVKTKFNAMFFISCLNQIPSTHKEEQEIQNIMWNTAGQYINDSLDKKLMFPVPQFYELSRLENFFNIEELVKYSTERSCHGCEKYFPYRIKTIEGVYSILPGDELYPDCIDKGDANITSLKQLPETNIQNRVLSIDEYNHRLFIKNFKSKDKHRPPINSKKI